MLNGVYESQRRLHAKLAKFHFSSLREKLSVYADVKTKMCRVVLNFYTPRCHFSLLSRPPYRHGFDMNLVLARGVGWSMKLTKDPHLPVCPKFLPPCV